MKARLNVSLVILLTLAFTALTAPNAFGCVPEDEKSGRCVMPPRPSPASDTQTPATVVAKPSATAAAQLAIAAPQPAATPSGLDPEHARVPMYVKPEYCIEAMCPGAVNAPPLNAPGNWEWIAPNTSLWYKMYDGHGLQLQMWVFANGQGGLTLDVFAPDQKDLYNSKPVGVGSPNRNYPGTDLFYSGRTSAYGIWHARLTNHNSVPVSYSFRYTVTTPSLNNVCDNCHKAIGYDWNACPDPAFCGKLHDYLEMNPQCYDHNIDADLANQCK